MPAPQHPSRAQEGSGKALTSARTSAPVQGSALPSRALAPVRPPATASSSENPHSPSAGPAAAAAAAAAAAQAPAAAAAAAAARSRRSVLVLAFVKALIRKLLLLLAVVAVRLAALVRRRRRCRCRRRLPLRRRRRRLPLRLSTRLSARRARRALPSVTTHPAAPRSSPASRTPDATGCFFWALVGNKGTAPGTAGRPPPIESMIIEVPLPWQPLSAQDSTPLHLGSLPPPISRCPPPLAAPRTHSQGSGPRAQTSPPGHEPRSPPSAQARASPRKHTLQLSSLSAAVSSPNTIPRRPPPPPPFCPPPPTTLTPAHPAVARVPTQPSPPGRARSFPDPLLPLSPCARVRVRACPGAGVRVRVRVRVSVCACACAYATYQPLAERSYPAVVRLFVLRLQEPLAIGGSDRKRVRMSNLPTRQPARGPRTPPRPRLPRPYPAAVRLQRRLPQLDHALGLRALQRPSLSARLPSPSPAGPSRATDGSSK